MKNYILNFCTLVLMVLGGVGGAMLFPRLEPLFPYASDNIWHCTMVGFSLASLTLIYNLVLVVPILERLLFDKHKSFRVSALGGGLYIMSALVLNIVIVSTAFIAASFASGSHLGSSIVTLLATIVLHIIFVVFKTRD